jgi:exopolyphosphatase/guanosine-5'-triphosphate,3'-diphosphate pyrophosphatase
VDSRSIRLRLKNRIELDIRRDCISGHPTVAYWLEKEQEFWDEVGLDFTLRAQA